MQLHYQPAQPRRVNPWWTAWPWHAAACPWPWDAWRAPAAQLEAKRGV